MTTDRRLIAHRNAPRQAADGASRGATLAVHMFDGDGPPLVLCHATGFHGRVWEPLAQRLASAFRCVAPDAGGHGDSTALPGPAPRWSEFGAEVLAVVDGLLLERPLGAGHSSGATSLLLAEQARPGTFEALYCYEPIVVAADPPLGRDRDSWLAERTRGRRPAFASRAAALASYAARAPLSQLHPDVLRAYVEHGFFDDADGCVRLRCAPEYEALVYEMATEHDCFVRLGEVHCPVTLLRGERSNAYPPGQFEALAERLANARCEVLHGLTHFGPLEDPGAVADRITYAFRR